MHICMYAYMHVCMYACMNVCMNACNHICIYACMHVCMYACMHVCKYASMYKQLCNYANMNVSPTYLSPIFALSQKFLINTSYASQTFLRLIMGISKASLRPISSLSLAYFRLLSGQLGHIKGMILTNLFVLDFLFLLCTLKSLQLMQVPAWF